MGREGTNLQLARAVAQTGSFPSRIPTTTKPTVTDAMTATGQVAIELSKGIGGSIPCGVQILPIGVGADDSTFSLRAILWKRMHTEVQWPSGIWVPQLLCGLDCTLGTTVGPGQNLPATYRFADTITLTAGTGEPVLTADVTNSGTVVRYSPTNNLIAWARVDDLNGGELLELTFNLGTATGANALISFMH